jgi:hypothetical protein
MKQKPFTDWNHVPLIIDLPTAAMLLGRSYKRLQLDAHKGIFPAFKNGTGKWSVEKTVLIKWIDSQKVTA